MSKTYSDVINTMVEVEKDGLSVDKLVITRETMETFLSDGQFTKKDEARQKDVIGEEWELPIESGSSNYILTDNGRRYPI